jgi:hypothetical protein
MPYCPNCSAELDGQEPVADCWNCQADTGAESRLKPVSRAPGVFRAFPKRAVKAPPVQGEVRPLNPVGEVLLRAFLGGGLWPVLAALAIASVMPYGGSSGYVTLWIFSTFAIGLWIAWPMIRLLPKKKKADLHPEP